MCASSDLRTWRASPRPARPARPARGLSLIELVVCIVLIGAVCAMLINVFSRLANRSADPLVQRQALAVAESLLQEIMAQGTGSTDQSGVANGMGPEPGESRIGAGNLYDNVDDYNGLTMNGIVATDGSAIPGLEAYKAEVSVRAQAMGAVPANQGLWVDVKITGPGGAEVLLSGWRARLD